MNKKIGNKQPKSSKIMESETEIQPIPISKDLAYRLNLWKRMEEGDGEAIIELTILSGIAKREDFELSEDSE